MDFNNQIPEWKNAGTEPSTNLKETGFAAGYKPPASVFNWFWSKVSKAITELQTKLSNVDSNKVAKITDSDFLDRVYAIGTDGSQKTIYAQAGINSAGNIPIYNSHNTIEVGTPTGDMDSANKEYVDSATSNKLDKVTSSVRVYPGIYATINTDGTPHLITATSDLSYIGNSSGYIPLYETGGQLKTATPTADDSAANKKYVDDAVSNLPDSGVGKSLAGKNVTPTSDTTVTAKTGAEIFNDYNTRIFDDDGIPILGNIATGMYSHAEGTATTATGDYSHAEGGTTCSYGTYSHAEGYSTEANGLYSHAEGVSTYSDGEGSHAEGNGTVASGKYSHAEGYATKAIGVSSHAEGENTTANGAYSHAGGVGTQAQRIQMAIGKYNKSSTGAGGMAETTGDAFIIGNGSQTTLGNAFRVTFAGKVFGLSAYGSSGADYAEYFEWIDGNTNNEDRTGYFVTVDGEKIRKATAEDTYILGIVSATPCVEGDVQSESWRDMYLKDVFGRKLTETVEVEETTDENGKVVPAHTEKRWILNPEYNPELEYVSRDERKEWSAVGLVGKLVAYQDGTCVAGGFCAVGNNGTATASLDNNGYKVLKVIDSEHVLVMFR